MKNLVNRSTALKDAALHEFLYWAGYGLTCVGVIETFLVKDSTPHFIMGLCAIAGSLWWAMRMAEHVDTALRRARMWS